MGGDDLPRPAAVPRPRRAGRRRWCRTPGRRSRATTATASPTARRPRTRRSRSTARRARWASVATSTSIARGSACPASRPPASRAGARSRTPARRRSRARPARRRRDRVDQLADAGADQRDRVLDRGGAEHRRGVDDLLDIALQQPELGRRRDRRRGQGRCRPAVRCARERGDPWRSMRPARRIATCQTAVAAPINDDKTAVAA